eukprot:COSAG05_NODE_1811_length_4037_cov_2.956323_4_plen_88_part_00
MHMFSNNRRIYGKSQSIQDVTETRPHHFHLLLIERVLYDSVQIHMVQLGALCCSGSLQSYRVAVVILNIIEVPKLVGVLGNQLVLYL